MIKVIKRPDVNMRHMALSQLGIKVYLISTAEMIDLIDIHCYDNHAAIEADSKSEKTTYQQISQSPE